MAEATAAGGGRVALLAGPVPMPASVRLPAAQCPAGPAALVRRAALHPAPAVRTGHPAAVRPAGDRVPEIHEVRACRCFLAGGAWGGFFLPGARGAGSSVPPFGQEKRLEKRTSSAHAWWTTGERDRCRRGRDLQRTSCSLVKNGETPDTLLFPSDALRVHIHAREDRVRQKSSSECTVCTCPLCVTIDIALWN